MGNPIPNNMPGLPTQSLSTSTSSSTNTTPQSVQEQQLMQALGMPTGGMTTTSTTNTLGGVTADQFSMGNNLLSSLGFDPLGGGLLNAIGGLPNSGQLMTQGPINTAFHPSMMANSLGGGLMPGGTLDIPFQIQLQNQRPMMQHHHQPAKDNTPSVVNINTSTNNNSLDG